MLLILIPSQSTFYHYMATFFSILLLLFIYIFVYIINSFFLMQIMFLHLKHAVSQTYIKKSTNKAGLVSGILRRGLAKIN